MYLHATMYFTNTNSASTAGGVVQRCYECKLLQLLMSKSNWSAKRRTKSKIPTPSNQIL